MNVIVTENGTYCEDCHADLKDPTDRDLSMIVKSRESDGTCGCCGAVVVAGDVVAVLF